MKTFAMALYHAYTHGDDCVARMPYYIMHQSTIQVLLNKTLCCHMFYYTHHNHCKSVKRVFIKGLHFMLCVTAAGWIIMNYE